MRAASIASAAGSRGSASASTNVCVYVEATVATASPSCAATSANDLATRELHRPHISRAQILVDGNFATSRTLMAGRFDKEFAYTPIGTVQPNCQQVQWELINIFRYTDDGRLIEEWVQTDTYYFLRQLGAVGS